MPWIMARPALRRAGPGTPWCPERSSWYSLDDREVDRGLGDGVDVVGERVQRDASDDLHDLRVVVAGGPDRGEVGLADLAAGGRDLLREAERRGGLGVARAALAVGGQL